MRRALALVALCGLAVAGCASARTTATAPSSPAPAVETRATVMVLGVYHFRAGGTDYIVNRLDDHLSPRRQAEIANARLAPPRPLAGRGRGWG